VRNPFHYRRLIFIALPPCLLLAGLFGFYEYRQNPNHGLPYHDSFAIGKAEEWKALGGTWELMNGSMRNDSDERGAKLLTGAPQWQNYSIEADVMLLGEGGNAGLILRSSDEEEGVDSYTGYYAGIRNLDNSLVLGRAGHGWMEVTRPFHGDRGQVLTSKWYHLKLMAYGCQLVAIANILPQGPRTSLTVNDVDCVRSGRAGLRSYAAGGLWRNVVIRQATPRDVAEMLAQSHEESQSSQAQAAGNDSQSSFHAPQAASPPHTPSSNPDAQPISSLKLFPIARPQSATIRGIVVLTSPALFVQDATGGILIKQSSGQPVRVGDEIEATGTVRPGAFSATLEDASVRSLWWGTPMPALSVTASQAATGAFDATFIEVEGRLRHKEYGPDDNLIFDFDSGPQSFRALMKRGRGNYLYDNLKLGSRLQIRGVAVVDSAYTQDITPFTLLVRSTDDIVELAGPPWYSAPYLVAMAIGFLLFALLANFVYQLVDKWRLRAIVEEREHLAFEMHDTLAQGFAGIGFQLEAIRTGVPDEQSSIHRQIDLASDLVRHSHAEARRTVDMLRPRQLESEGLLNALALCARRLVAGGSVTVIARSLGEVRPVPLRMSDNLYRIGQEALANAVRHAHPTTLNIVIEYKKNSVRLLIGDDGTGFVQEKELGGAELGGFGVLGMRKRAASISAQLDVSSVLGRGTEVSVTAPLPPRITFISWPGMLSKFLREHLRNATTADPPHPHPYRR
jgi:signal transduction histidine kinase